MSITDRAAAVDAADVLNDFIGDLITGVMLLRENSAQHQQGKIPLNMMIPIQKMCLSHLVLALAKFDEFWKHYQKLVPQKHRNDCLAILKILRDRKVIDFRNRCVGHIWDKKQNRPLAHTEVMNALAVIMEPNITDFLNWINNPTSNIYPSTVVSVVEAVRDDLMLAYEIQPDEFVNR
jgi:hypothetical protein